MLKSLEILFWWCKQVSKVCQCYNGFLNAYLDKCLDIIFSFDEFIIKHIPREENGKANTLARQASDYNVFFEGKTVGEFPIVLQFSI
jgi:hypothetical protein